MDEQSYLAQSGEFDSGRFHTELVPPHEMDAMLHAADVATRWADRVKRALIYGAEMEKKGMWTPVSVRLDEEHHALIHGVLGLFTEAGELMQHLHAVLKGETKVDPVNILEELGDCNWYAAVLHRWNGSTPSDSYDANIAKLRARYPEKFTEKAALDRNLDAERRTLEQHTPGQGGQAPGGAS